MIAIVDLQNQRQRVTSTGIDHSHPRFPFAGAREELVDGSVAPGWPSSLASTSIAALIFVFRVVLPFLLLPIVKRPL